MPITEVCLFTMLMRAGFSQRLDGGDYATYVKARKACDERIRSEVLSVEEYALLHGLIVQAGKAARTAGGWQIYWPAIAGN